MIDALSFAGALTTGASAALAVFAIGARGQRNQAADWLRRRRPAAGRAAGIASKGLPNAWVASRGGREVASWLAVQLQRAGWSPAPERFMAAVLACTLALAAVGGACGALIGAAAGVATALMAAVAAPTLAWYILVRAVRLRRDRLLAELAPTLELLSLELSAGASASAGLNSVAAQTGGALSRELRHLLVASQMAGSASLDVRVEELAKRLDLPPLVTLAAILGTSREYGSGVSQGVRALASDLRRAQKRRLIATSRRSLNRILVPAAAGILLPFMAILLYPAIASLSASFR